MYSRTWIYFLTIFTNISAKDVYFGEVAKVECEAFKHAKIEILHVEELSWTVRSSNYSQLRLQLIQNGIFTPLPKSYLAAVDTNGTLFMPILDSKLSSIYVQCYVKTMDNNTNTSDTALQVKDCVDGGNPCVYGSCSTYESANAKGLKRSICGCRQGYTGRFCLTDINASFGMEMFLYSPVFGITIYIVIVMTFYFLKKNKSLRHLPKTRKFHFPITLFLNFNCKLEND